MKRCIVVLLLATLLSTIFSPVSTAEDFIIHNGTTFGMSREDVTDKERSSGFHVEVYDKTVLIDGGFLMECPLHSGSYLSVNGTIAGIDNAEVEYHFNNNGLESAIYSLVESNYEGGCDSIFKEINGILMNKYGNPDDITKTVIESQYIDTCVLSKAAKNASSFSWFNYSVPDLQVYTQEIDDDTLVAIVPIIIRSYHQGYLIEQLKIEYHIYSKESIEKAILEISADQAQAIDKLIDDL